MFLRKNIKGVYDAKYILTTDDLQCHFHYYLQLPCRSISRVFRTKLSLDCFFYKPGFLSIQPGVFLFSKKIKFLRPSWLADYTVDVSLINCLAQNFAGNSSNRTDPGSYFGTWVEKGFDEFRYFQLETFQWLLCSLETKVSFLAF